MLSITDALIATLVMGGITLITRAFPFLLFSHRKPPSFLLFVEKYIPPMIIAILIVYCLKDITWSVWPSGIKELTSILIVVLLHLAKKNAMLSIFGGTAFYMLISRLL